MVSLGVPPPVEDSIVTVCTKLKELFTVGVKGTSINGGPGRGVMGEGVPILAVGEDVVSDMGGGACGSGGMGMEVSH